MELNKSLTKLMVIFACGATWSANAMAAGRLTIAPYASVSSSKTIKPKVGDKANSAEEAVTQRQTYGLKVDIRLSQLFSFTANAGINKVDTTKKAKAMVDEFGEMNFAKDGQIDNSSKTAEYIYKEEQRVGSALISINPSLMPGTLWGKIGLGVRARERFVDIDDKTKYRTVIHDQIRYHAVGVAGVQARLLGSIYYGLEYKFYFIKFPKMKPFEQEVAVSMGINI